MKIKGIAIVVLEIRVRNSVSGNNERMRITNRHWSGSDPSYRKEDNKGVQQVVDKFQFYLQQDWRYPAWRNVFRSVGFEEFLDLKTVCLHGFQWTPVYSG